MKNIETSSELTPSKESYKKVLRYLLVVLAVSILSLSTTKSPIVNAESANEALPEVFYGEPATQEQAAFSVRVFGKGVTRLSGIILGDRVVATAYHGVEDDNIEFDVSQLRVEVAGDNSREPYKVKEIRVIGKNLPGNDRVLLLLEKPIEFDDFVKPIKIGEFHMRTSQLFVIGHGTYEDHNFSQEPRVGKQNIYMGNSTCANPYTILTKNENPNDPAPYYRDSGGGLLAHIEEDNELYEPGYYLLGTTHSMCSGSNYPDDKTFHTDYVVSYQAMDSEKIKNEVNQAIAETSLWPVPVELFLPNIRDNHVTKPRSENLMPYISN